MNDKTHKQRGVSLIAAIFIIVILAFMGVIFVALINTGSFTAANDAQSAQALYVAEGGTEYALNQYKNGTNCNALNYVNVNLGPGRFTTAGVPYTPAPTTLTAAISNVATIIPVADATGYYPYPGQIIIESEVIEYGTIVGSQFRNVRRGAAGSTPAAHPAGATVTQNFCLIRSIGTVGSAQREVEQSARWLPGAMMVYAKLNGDPIPYYRRWDGTSWGPELQANAVGAAGRSIQYIILKFARTRNEAILGILDNTGNITVQVWNGSVWGPTLLLANIGTTNDDYRGFDIEYETNGDQALVVYNSNIPNQISYRVLNGPVWTPPATRNLASMSIGIPLWIELAANPSLASSEIAMIVLGSNSSVYGLRWDGANWDDMGTTQRWETTASTTAYKAIHVAYEQQTQRALFVWGRSALHTIGYRIWNRNTSILSVVITQNIANIGNHTVRWMRLASNPFANDIMLGIQDSGSDLITSLWNGAAWDPNGIQHDNSLEDASRNFDLIYETYPANAGRLWVLWGNGSLLSRRQWTGAAWGAIATTGDDTSYVTMAAHPLSGAVLSAIYESTNAGAANRDIWESHLTQGTAAWSARNVIWGGRTVAASVMERVALAVERYNPLTLYGWREAVH